MGVARPGIYWTLAIALLVVGAIVLAGGWIGCEWAIHPEAEPTKYRLTQFELPKSEPVSFPSRGGVMLSGWFLPGVEGATVILRHPEDGTPRRVIAAIGPHGRGRTFFLAIDETWRWRNPYGARHFDTF